MSDFHDLCRPLGELTRDHALCQNVETSLAAVPADDAVKARVPRWPNVLADLLQIAARRSQDPLVIRMVEYARTFDSAVGQAASEAFVLLRDQFGFLFGQVDRDLLAITDRIVRQAEVLSAKL